LDSQTNCGRLCGGPTGGRGPPAKQLAGPHRGGTQAERLAELLADRPDTGRPPMATPRPQTAPHQIFGHVDQRIALDARGRWPPPGVATLGPALINGDLPHGPADNAPLSRGSRGVVPPLPAPDHQPTVVDPGGPRGAHPVGGQQTRHHAVTRDPCRPHPHGYNGFPGKLRSSAPAQHRSRPEAPTPVSSVGDAARAAVTCAAAR